VFQAGPHGTGVANTDEVEVRSVFLMDPTNAPAYVSYMDTGVYSLIGFYNEFIEADATSGVAAQEAYIAPLLNWYRATYTNDNAGVIKCCSNRTYLKEICTTGEISY
jgi:hypothetical protein